MTLSFGSNCVLMRPLAGPSHAPPHASHRPPAPPPWPPGRRTLLLWPLAGVLVLAAISELSLQGVGHQPGTLLLAAGRFCGLTGLWLWVASFLLLLRPAALEQACGGLDQVYRLHHGLGIAAYIATLAHPLLLATAQGPRSEAARALLFAMEGPILAGWAGLVLLMAILAATFWWRLPYRLWRRIHLLSAPAFALAAGHAWILAPAPSWAYRALVGMALACALVAGALRYGLRNGRYATCDYRVARVAHPGPEITELTLTPLGVPLPWQPGQFVFAAFADGRHFHGCGEFHPFTLAGTEDPGGRLTLLIKSLGPCTRNIQTIEPGVPARVQGPFGAFFGALDPARPQLWIAGGIGITPFLAAADRLSPAAEPVDLVHLHRDDPSSCAARLQQLAQHHPRLTPHDLAGETSAAVLFEWLTTHLAHLADRQVFLCGPPGLVDELRPLLAQAGIRREDIHWERFDLR